MRINHNDAIELEYIVRKVFACSRGDMGGYIDADHFESEPFDAALIALAPLWEKAAFHEMEVFLLTWEHALRNEADEDVDIGLYIEQLGRLVTELLRR